MNSAKEQSWALPAVGFDHNILVYATPLIKDIQRHAEYNEVRPVDLVDSYVQLDVDLLQLKPNEEFVLSTTDAWEDYPDLMDPKFKPRLLWQIGEPRQEVSVNVAAEDIDLIMDFCNTRKISLQEFMGRSIKMGLDLSNKMKEDEGSDLFVYDVDTVFPYYVDIKRPAEALDGFWE